MIKDIIWWFWELIDHIYKYHLYVNKMIIRVLLFTMFLFILAERDIGNNVTSKVLLFVFGIWIFEPLVNRLRYVMPKHFQEQIKKNNGAKKHGKL